MHVPASLHIAIDLGAGSGRVVVGGFGPDDLFFEEAHRFSHPLAPRGGRLRWDAAHILAGIVSGLSSSARIAADHRQAVTSLGVDSWGVDFGLLDDVDDLIEDPVSYRDARTMGQMERVFARMSREEIFRRTGIQFLPLNTIYQLFAEVSAGALPARAVRLVLIADLFHVMLGGRVCCEYTNATTTQLLSPSTGCWDDELFSALGLPRRLMPVVVPPGTTLGDLRPALQDRTGLGQVSIVAPATHDTASAVAGAPLEEGWAYISSGTWSLVGIERPTPLVDDEARRLNFTNEGGAGGRTLFHQNVMGMWLLDRCRADWQASGTPFDYAELSRLAEEPAANLGFVDPDDRRFFNPASMATEIAESLRETGQSVPGDPVSLSRVILDSLAQKYALVIGQIGRLLGRPVRGIRIVGGGSQNHYLNQTTADATGLPVVAGPVEATAIGNLVVQAMKAGRFSTLGEARQFVARASPTTSYQPGQPGMRATRAARFRAHLERSGAEL